MFNLRLSLIHKAYTEVGHSREVNSIPRVNPLSLFSAWLALRLDVFVASGREMAGF